MWQTRRMSTSTTTGKSHAPKRWACSLSLFVLTTGGTAPLGATVRMNSGGVESGSRQLLRAEEVSADQAASAALRGQGMVLRSTGLALASSPALNAARALSYASLNSNSTTSPDPVLSAAFAPRRPPQQLRAQSHQSSSTSTTLGLTDAALLEDAPFRATTTAPPTATSRGGSLNALGPPAPGPGAEAFSLADVSGGIGSSACGSFSAAETGGCTTAAPSPLPAAGATITARDLSEVRTTLTAAVHTTGGGVPQFPGPTSSASGATSSVLRAAASRQILAAPSPALVSQRPRASAFLDGPSSAGYHPDTSHTVAGDEPMFPNPIPSHFSGAGVPQATPRPPARLLSAPGNPATFASTHYSAATATQTPAGPPTHGGLPPHFDFERQVLAAPGAAGDGGGSSTAFGWEQWKSSSTSGRAVLSARNTEFSDGSSAEERECGDVLAPAQWEQELGGAGSRDFNVTAKATSSLPIETAQRGPPPPPLQGQQVVWSSRPEVVVGGQGQTLAGTVEPSGKKFVAELEAARAIHSSRPGLFPCCSEGTRNTASHIFTHPRTKRKLIISGSNFPKDSNWVRTAGVRYIFDMSQSEFATSAYVQKRVTIPVADQKEEVVVFFAFLMDALRFIDFALDDGKFFAEDSRRWEEMRAEVMDAKSRSSLSSFADELALDMHMEGSRGRGLGIGKNWGTSPSSGAFLSPPVAASSSAAARAPAAATEGGTGRGSASTSAAATPACAAAAAGAASSSTSTPPALVLADGASLSDHLAWDLENAGHPNGRRSRQLQSEKGLTRRDSLEMRRVEFESTDELAQIDTEVQRRLFKEAEAMLTPLFWAAAAEREADGTSSGRSMAPSWGRSSGPQVHHDVGGEGRGGSLEWARSQGLTTTRRRVRDNGGGGRNPQEPEVVEAVEEAHLGQYLPELSNTRVSGSGAFFCCFGDRQLIQDAPNGTSSASSSVSSDVDEVEDDVLGLEERQRHAEQRAASTQRIVEAENCKKNRKAALLRLFGQRQLVSVGTYGVFEPSKPWRGAESISPATSSGMWPRNLLVNCAQGKSRSVTVVLAYLMVVQDLSLRQAFRVVYQKRPLALPNKGFFAGLQVLEKYLNFGGDDYHPTVTRSEYESLAEHHSKTKGQGERQSCAETCRVS